MNLVTGRGYHFRKRAFEPGATIRGIKRPFLKQDSRTKRRPVDAKTLYENRSPTSGEAIKGAHDPPGLKKRGNGTKRQ